MLYYSLPVSKVTQVRHDYVTVKITRHGTNKAYVVGCRCDDCTEAHTKYMRRYRKSLQEKAS